MPLALCAIASIVGAVRGPPTSRRRSSGAASTLRTTGSWRSSPSAPRDGSRNPPSLRRSDSLRSTRSRIWRSPAITTRHRRAHVLSRRHDTASYARVSERSGSPYGRFGVLRSWWTESGNANSWISRLRLLSDEPSRLTIDDVRKRPRPPAAEATSSRESAGGLPRGVPSSP